MFLLYVVIVNLELYHFNKEGSSVCFRTDRRGAFLFIREVAARTPD